MKRRRSVPPRHPQQEPTTGSPTPGEPVYLAVGRLRRSHGISGEMLMDVLTDFPERIQVGNTMLVGEAHLLLTVASVRGHNRELIIRFEGIDTPEAAGDYRNMIVYVEASRLPKLPEGEYYHHELLGLTVVNEAGETLGKLDQILETGANDVYIVKPDQGKELLLPAVDSVILKVDLSRKEMLVRPPEWD